MHFDQKQTNKEKILLMQKNIKRVSKKTIFKRIAVVFAVIFIMIPAVIYILIPNFYIQNREGTIKFKVPKYIVLTKNCKRYIKFIEENIPAMFMFSADCPWAEIGPIAHFTLNDTEFHIPRTYMWQGKRWADGPRDAIYGIARYPSMERGWADGDEHGDVEKRRDNIVFSVYVRKKEMCLQKALKYKESKKVCEISKGYYNSEDLSKYKMVKIGYRSDLGINEYKGDGLNKYKRFYIKGSNLRSPEYQLECSRSRKAGGGPKSPFFFRECKVSFFYNKNMYVVYDFMGEHHLKDYADIHNKMIDLLNKFTLKDKDYNKDLKLEIKK